MLPTAPPTAAELTVNRARLHGGAAWRRELEVGLAAVHAGDVVGPGEVLFVPHIRATTALSATLPPSLFAARLTDRLRQMAGEALVDPAAHQEGQRPLRFRSFAAYATWLLATWLQAPAPVSGPVLAAALGGQSIEAWQRRRLLDDGRALVRVAQSLEGQGLLAAWLGRLGEPDIAQAIATIARDYALPDLAAALVTGGQGHATEQDASIEPAGAALPPTTRKPQPRPALELLPVLRARAEVAVPVFSQLPVAVRLLLVGVLGIAQRAGEMRLLDVADWSAVIADSPPQPIAERRATRVPRKARTAAILSSRAAPDPLPLNQASGDSCAVQRVAATIAGETAEPVIDQPQAEDAEPTDASEIPPAPPADLPANATAAMPAPQSNFSTGFGGLFFLLNVLLWMGLYPDFTRPRDKGLDASPFWLLAQLGRKLFGRAFADDPLHGWLVEQGVAAPLPRHWRVDPAWLDGLAPPAPSAGSKRGWLAQCAAFLKFRLLHSAPGFRLRQLRLPADIYLDEDRLTVRFSLADLPLPLRLAGLDRDIGWLPAEGRIVKFEFA